MLIEHNVGNIPLFFFVIKCFIQRLATKSIVEFSGAHEETVHKYLNIIRTVLCSRFEQEVRKPDFMFGGDGTIVEIDEAMVCKRKYERGRPEKKEIWVVGITEVPDSSRTVNDPALLQALMKRESDRRRYAEQRAAGRKRKTAKQHVLPVSVFHPTRRQFDVIDGPAPWFDETTTEVRGEDDSRRREEEIQRLFLNHEKANRNEPAFLWLKNGTAKL